MPDASLIERRGWRQWSFLNHADIAAIREGDRFGPAGDTSDTTRLLIVSQDCDLVHHSYDNEPLVEAYICEPLSPQAKVDGNLTAAKNPRDLIVPFLVDGDRRWFHLQANGKTVFRRHALESLAPDRSVAVPAESVAILQRWLVNRIFRTAFPSAFNERTATARKQMGRLLKQGGARLLGLYINLKPWEELPAEEDYSVDLIGLVAEDLDLSHRESLERLLGEIALGFERASGIRLTDYRILSDDEFPLSLLRTHRLYPLDYLSLSDKPGGELPPLG